MSLSGNRLRLEASPYLLLHASNPVDWHPWGEAAFALARQQRKPIFLSIGYYTCHWCHVMERESFADPALAERLNRDFISIKVDREERPDIDRLYMAFVQATTGSGGWPLSAFLTPELKPFFGGTYFPPRDRHGHPGFARVLESIAAAWREQPGRLEESARQAAEALAAHTRRDLATGGEPPPSQFSDQASAGASADRLVQHFEQAYDAEFGGFGSAPKFPRPVAFSFLLRHAARAAARGDAPLADRARAMTLASLRAMARGGLHDQIGGGFHRYATDPAWLVPHFEKMLYDQAQLAIAFLEAWQATGDADLAATLRATLDFVLREMTSPEGGFFSAQDADSEIPPAHRQPGGPAEGEGAFYLWTAAEIDQLLGPGDAPLFAAHYGVRQEGNVPPRMDPQGEFAGKNILHQAAALEAAAAQFGLPPLAAGARIEAAAAALYRARRLRPPPPTDDKIIAAWNGLMISALALAGAALDEPRYLDAARAAAAFLERELWDGAAGLLYRRFRRGNRAIAGFVEDYSYLIQGLLDLHQADFDPRWQRWAAALQASQDARFTAPEGGYYGAGEDPDLFLRLREDYDGAEPSPNSVSVANLARLGRPEDARRVVHAFGERLRAFPEALPLMAAHACELEQPPRELVIAGVPDDPAARALLACARRRFLPGLALRLAPGGSPEYPLRNGAAAAYFCENSVCQLPVADPESLARLLQNGYGLQQAPG